MSFAHVQTQVINTYQAGQLAESLALVVAAMARFPDQAATLHMWRVSLLTAMGDPTAALQAFDESIRAGLWFDLDYLDHDPDFQPLHEYPEWKRLVEICRQRREVARANVTPYCLTLSPADATGPHPLVMALHGNGHNPHQEEDFWRPLVDQGYLLALPQSTQLSGPTNYIWTDHTWGFRDAHRYFADLTAAQTVDPDRVVLGGFSMGGGLAVRLALTGALPTRGFVAVGPYLPDFDQLRRDLAASHVQGVRGYLVIGEQDQDAVELGTRLVDLMAEHGLQCRLEIHPDLGHAYPESFTASLEQALAFILG